MDHSLLSYCRKYIANLDWVFFAQSGIVPVLYPMIY